MITKSARVTTLYITKFTRFMSLFAVNEIVFIFRLNVFFTFLSIIILLIIYIAIFKFDIIIQSFSMFKAIIFF
jgi:hypothetical protein